MSTLEDLLNDEESSDDEIITSATPTSTLDLKQLNIDELLNMNEDDEEDAAALSSTIYEQFSHLMKTNEIIQRELATSSSTTASPRLTSEFKKTVTLSATKADEPDDFLDTGLTAVTSSDILKSLIENDDDETDDNSPREGRDSPSSLNPATATTASSEQGLAALRAAEAREKKHLHYVEPVSVSALQIRRSTVSTNSSNSSGNSNSNNSNSSTGGGSASSAVMTGIEELSLVTNQLKKNASYQQHGPGTATAIALCGKFVAIGTIKGFILIFDHHQEIRKVLTHPSPIKPSSAAITSNNSNSPMAVVGLDCLPDGSMIVAGHAMGDVLFWDSLKGVVLKQVKDPSNAEILRVRFIYPVATPDSRHTSSLLESDTFHAVVLTASSVVNRYKLSKSLLSTWATEVDCLLDESSGRVVAFSVLDPFSFFESTMPSSSTTTASNEEGLSGNTTTATASLSRFYSDLRQQRGVVQIFSFSFPTQTCIVQSSPEVRILFKWSNPNYSKYESKDSVESLDWTWMRTPFDLSTASNSNKTNTSNEGMICAVLARARETSIDLLVLRVKRTTSSQAAVNDPTTTSSTTSTSTSSTAGRGSGRASILSLMGSALTGGGLTAYQSQEDIPSLSFECLPWTNRTISNQSDHLLAIKWIKASQLLAFTKTEVLLLDSSLNVLERCLLLPSISNAYLATSDRRNSTTSEVRPELRTTTTGEGYVLTATACFKVFTKSPFEQANSLINSGRWLEGLSLIVENISKSPTLLAVEGEHIRRYIINYTLLAVKRSSTASSTTLTSDDTNSNTTSTSHPSKSRGGPASTSAVKHSRNHYRLVASVCVEYCVATRQFDLLFHEILDVFRTEGEQDLLLESLEPFLLNQSIARLPLSILLDFFQMGVSQSRLASVERCLIACRQPAQLLQASNEREVQLRERLFRELYRHQLWSCYLYLDSLSISREAEADSYRHAFQSMFQFLLVTYGDELLLLSGTNSSGLESFEEREVKRERFYKLLLFVLFLCEGRVFPKGEATLSFFAPEDISFPFSPSSSLVVATPSNSSSGSSRGRETLTLAGIIEEGEDPTQTTPSHSHSRSNTSNTSSCLAKLVNGYQVNAMWTLLQLLTIDEMPPFLEIATATATASSDLTSHSSSITTTTASLAKVMTREEYETHSLREIEFPLLHFFARFDHQTLFQVLVKGVESLLALFCSHSSTNTNNPNPNSTTNTSISAHNHLIIEKEGILVTREVVSLSTRQKNETKIMALLQNVFLYVKEEKERASSSGETLLADFFRCFSPLFTRLTNATISNDLLHELIRYRSTQRLKPDFSLIRCEEQLRGLIENQIKLLLGTITPNTTHTNNTNTHTSNTNNTSGGGGHGSSAKFNAFSDKLVKLLEEQGFYWTAFLVKKYHVKLFFLSRSPPSLMSSGATSTTTTTNSSSTNSNSSTSKTGSSILSSGTEKPKTPNQFLPQLRSYLELIRSRREAKTSNTIVNTSPLLSSYNTLVASRTSPLPSNSNSNSNSSIHRMSLLLSGNPSNPNPNTTANNNNPSEAINKEEEEEASQVLFRFISESLEYFEREKAVLLSTPVSSPLSTTSSSAKHHPITANANTNTNTNSSTGSSSSGWSLQVIDELNEKFREAVIDVISDLFDLSIDQTIQSVLLPHFLSPSSLHLVMEASRRTPQLQFRAFHRLIVSLFNDHQLNQSTVFSIKQYFQNNDLLHFLRLHCSFAPETLLSFLKSYVFLSGANGANGANGVSGVTSGPGLASGAVNSRGSVIMIHQEAIETPLPLDEMAGILREFPHIFDGIAFFEEKFGKVEEALTILLRDFSNKLKAVRKEIDSSLRLETSPTTSNSTSTSNSNSKSVNPATVQLLLHVRASLSSLFVSSHSSKYPLKPSSSSTTTMKSKPLSTPSTATATATATASTSQVSQNQLQQLMGELASQVPSCRLLRYSLTCITELCERQSPRITGLGSAVVGSEGETAEKLWRLAFDHLLTERQLMKESMIVSSASQITSQFLTFLIQEFMNRMKVSISPQDIITQVLNQTSSSTSSSSSGGKHSLVLGELSEMMTTMMTSNAAELLLYENMKKILYNDVKMIHQLKIRKKRGYVFKSEATANEASVGPESSEETKDSAATAVGEKTSSTMTASQKYLERKGGLSNHRNKTFRLRDLKNITNRAQEKLQLSLPRVTVPANISDFGALDFEARKPGQLERTARYAVTIDVPIPWQ